VVTPDWLERLVACAESDGLIAMAGPLSNTASWQSVPEVVEGDDWAANPLPPDVSIEQMAEIVSRSSARLYPEMAFLNGFCLLIDRRLIEAIGTFDENVFGAGYGEENDFALRARAAGFKLAVADDCYVHHAQSRSYSHEQRARLSHLANQALIAKHGQARVQEGVAQCSGDRVLAGIRARVRTGVERARLVEEARRQFAGKRLLFVLPAKGPGGGANIVFSEARAMRAMGVDAAVFNLDRFRSSFERAYPGLDLPVVYGDYNDVPGSLIALIDSYDAMVATLYASVGPCETCRAPRAATVSRSATTSRISSRTSSRRVATTSTTLGSPTSSCPTSSASPRLSGINESCRRSLASTACSSVRAWTSTSSGRGRGRRIRRGPFG